MTPEEILDDAVIDTGWSEEEQRKILLDFIEELDLVPRFRKFIQKRADRDSDYDVDEDDE